MKKLVITKKIIATLILFLGFTSFSQNMTNMEFLIKDEARAFADSMISISLNPHEFLKDRYNERSGKHRWYYASPDLSDSDKEADCPKCAIVEFEVYYEGANEDLQIEGVQKYIFKVFRGKYLTVYPAWQKYFYPESTKESALTNANERISNRTTKKVWLQKIQENWTITNLNY